MPGSPPRLALVTGASSGIGREFARELARQGSDLILVARRADRLREAAAEAESLGRKAQVIPADLSVAGEVDRVVAEVRRQGSGPDLLVNNAGFGAYAATLSTPLPTLRDMMRLNVEALVSLAFEFGKDMAAQGGGAIINIASTASFQPVPNFGTYAATKAFVLSFSEALRTELEPSVRVVCLCPGMTATEFHGVAKLRGRLMKFPSMTAAAVVQVGLRGLERGQGVVVAGLTNRITAWLASKLPRRIVLASAKRLFRDSTADGRSVP